MPLPQLPDRAYASGRAVADDGVGLAWQSFGEGPAIVCCNGVGVSTFFWHYVVRQFSDRYRVVVWDYRGHGSSDPVPDPRGGEVGVPRHTQDMRVVLDAAGIDQACFFGHSMGCQVLFEAWRQYPERMLGMVPILGSAGRTLETFFDNPRSPLFFRMAGRLVAALDDRTHAFVRPLLLSRIAWPFTRTMSLVDRYYASRDDMLPYMAHLATLDMRVFIRVVNRLNDHDAWDALPTIDVPVLVIAADNDAFTPVWLSRKMASLIPGAEILVLAEASHAAIIEQPETINHRIERFIRERRVFGR